MYVLGGTLGWFLGLCLMVFIGGTATISLLPILINVPGITYLIGALNLQSSGGWAFPTILISAGGLIGSGLFLLLTGMFLLGIVDILFGIWIAYRWIK
jgi:hypothetical protein